MYTVHSRSHYTGLLWSVVRADYSNNTPLTHTCMERETGTVVGGAAGQRRDEVTERSMAGPSLESSPEWTYGCLAVHSKIRIQEKTSTIGIILLPFFRFPNFRYVKRG